MHLHFRPIVLSFLALLSPLAVAQVERADINLDYVSKLALERARSPFHSPRLDLPELLREEKLNYDNYRKIRFRHDRALWLSDGLPFRVEFFHPGYIYHEPVRMFEFTKTHVQNIRFVQDWFDYSDLEIDNIPVNTGYAGFKIAHPLNRPAEYSELAVFQGASYFRMLGKGQRYGASARGLALDCGEPDRPEEFPIFTDFWLGKPNPGDPGLTLYALLDSVSCTGAYQFQISPGDTTVTKVTAVIYMREPDKIAAVNKERKPLATLGMAPLTSMFWFGENSERKFDDYRPEVHDSDGLLMHMDGGEIVWRPLNNPPVMRHSVFATKNVHGFGLLQRDRHFGSYHELFNHYHQVPSMWVTPGEDWGEGEVHLLELPTNYEGLDNIAAFWNPKTKPEPLQPFRFSYTLQWMSDAADALSENRVIATRVGPQSPNSPVRQIHIDFGGPAFESLPADQPPQIVASCTPNATIVETQVIRSPFTPTWRAIVKFEPKPDNKDPVDLRCSLNQGGKPLGETWAYLWSPL